MSLRLLVDEDSQSRRLVWLLRNAGHDVVTVNEADLAGAMDETVFACAQAERRVILTANVRDFRLLHERDVAHMGVLVICHDGDPAKDMTGSDIVRAIGHVEEAEVEIAGGFHVLNAWRR